jgi:signal transduction histidine kinase
MAALFTVLLGISAAILVYLLYHFGKQDFLRETEAAIDAEISMLSTIQNATESHEQIIGYLDDRIRYDSHVFFRLENENGQRIAGNINMMPEHIERLKEGILRFYLHTEKGDHTLAAKIYTLPDNSSILVARDIGDLAASYERLKGLSAVIMVLMLAVVLVSFGISHFVVSRINRIAVTAHDIISTNDLSRRIGIDTQWDDLSHLAQLLNRLLVQVETLMIGVREVSNNIAHDLRTPLAGLRSDIESLKGTQIEDHHLDTLIADTDKMMRMFQSLLRITNIEQGKRSQSFAIIDIGALLSDVMELYEPVAEEKNVIFKAVMPNHVNVKGDADLLFQLFANVLDNAVKFSPSASSIEISVSQKREYVSIAISDHGSGIPDNEKEKVFKHFYRGDTSRSTEGNGLGLSLVKAIVKQHQGKITLEDAHPGLTVRVMLQPYQ